MLLHRNRQARTVSVRILFVFDIDVRVVKRVLAAVRRRVSAGEQAGEMCARYTAEQITCRKTDSAAAFCRCVDRLHAQHRNERTRGRKQLRLNAPTTTKFAFCCVCLREDFFRSSCQTFVVSSVSVYRAENRANRAEMGAENAQIETNPVKIAPRDRETYRS